MRINPCVLILFLFVATLASGQAKGISKLSAEDRAFTASKVSSIVQGYFFSAKDLPSSGLDGSYKTYLRTALTSDDRRQFDLATMEFVAKLHNGHTFFSDTWLEKNNPPLGFYAAPLGGLLGHPNQHFCCPETWRYHR